MREHCCALMLVHLPLQGAQRERSTSQSPCNDTSDEQLEYQYEPTEENKRDRSREASKHGSRYGRLSSVLVPAWTGSMYRIHSMLHAKMSAIVLLWCQDTTPRCSVCMTSCPGQLLLV